MKIGIVGLGFVGLSLTSVLAYKGYNTIGIDVDKEKESSCSSDSSSQLQKTSTTIISSGMIR